MKTLLLALLLSSAAHAGKQVCSVEVDACYERLGSVNLGGPSCSYAITKDGKKVARLDTHDEAVRAARRLEAKGACLYVGPAPEKKSKARGIDWGRL